MSRWTFDRPDPRKAERMRESLTVQALGGDFASDAYHERVRARLPGVTTEAEREASRRFNRQWSRKLHKGFPCAGKSCDGGHLFGEPGITCFWCRQKAEAKLARKTPGHHSGTPAKSARKR